MLYIKKFTLSNRFIVNIYDKASKYGYFVLRGSSGEKNLSLYISNSIFKYDKSEKMRIDSGTDNFYIGSGNNINDAWSEKLPKINFSNDATTDTVHFTNKVYRKE